MNKKGFWFNVWIALVTFLILFYAHHTINDKYNSIGKKIGERQISIMETYRVGEDAMLYMDRSAKAAAFSVYDVKKQSLDYELYEKRFIELLSGFNYNGFPVFKDVKFSIDIKDKDSLIIEGIGDRMIKIPTICQDKLVASPEFYYDFLPEHYGDEFDKSCGVYAIKPMFRVEIDKKIWEG